MVMPVAVPPPAIVALIAVLIAVLIAGGGVVGGVVGGVPSALNNRPVVGVLTQPLSTSADPKREILVASYVDWIQSSGARVVPLRYTASTEGLQDMLGQINGVLFPGGLASMTNTTYAASAQFVFRWMMSRNAVAGSAPFPFWGTCLGFEQMLVYSGSNPNSRALLSPTDAENVFLPLQFAAAVKTNGSRLMSDASASVVETLASQNVSINMHDWGILKSTFEDPASGLSHQYTLLATSFDRRGAEFASLVEHRKFPIFGSQFHPEKNAFEWDQGHPESVHTSSAVESMQYFTNRFVDACRSNMQEFHTPSALIYRYNATFTGINRHVERTYFFNN